MNRYRKELFPVSIFHSAVEDNERLKSLIIPYINKFKGNNLSPPDGWFTNKLITSFEKDDINQVFFDGGEISKEVERQYMQVFKGFFDANWEIDIESMWFNCYENGEYQEGHTHMGNYRNHIAFACVHFLSFDSKVHSPIIFTDPISMLRSSSLEMKSNNYDEKYVLNVKEGDFIMFPCYLEHEVKPGIPTPKNPRITLSLNLKVLRYNDE